jgi:lipoprotein-anchoring transpeptidase ErfK/SrfK
LAVTRTTERGLADAAAPVYDIDICASDIIVRSHRTICYENGTVYEGFVEVTKGLADGEGRVTWGASAGRSNRKTYTGQFTAGRKAERVKIKRPGQIGIGNHAYNGTVEVSRRSARPRLTRNGIVQVHETESSQKERSKKVAPFL